MVIMDLYTQNWDSVPDPTPNNPDNWKWVRSTRFNGFSPKQSFWNQMKIKRANVEFTCGCCSKKRGKGMRYIGNNWERVCHFCLGEWIENSKNKLNEMSKFISEQEAILEENKDMWYKEAMVGQLQ